MLKYEEIKEQDIGRYCIRKRENMKNGIGSCIQIVRMSPYDLQDYYWALWEKGKNSFWIIRGGKVDKKLCIKDIDDIEEVIDYLVNMNIEIQSIIDRT